MNQSENDLSTYVLLAGCIVIFLPIVLFGFLRWLLDFRRELHYLEREIYRTHGKRQKYWIQKRRKLWLSILPFVKY